MSNNKNDKEKIMKNISKSRNFFTSKGTTIFLFIITIIFFCIFLYSFINNDDRGPIVDKKEEYHSDMDKDVRNNIQSLLDTRLGFLAEIDSVVSRGDLKKDEKIHFIKDIKTVMQENTKSFNQEIDTLDKVSIKPKQDIERMNNINHYSIEYANAAIRYVESDYSKKEADAMFHNSSLIRTSYTKMNFNDLRTKGDIKLEKNNPVK